MSKPSPLLDRRQVLAALSSLGVGTAVFRRALADQAEGRREVSAEMIAAAEWVAGLQLTEEQRTATSRAVQSLQRKLDALREQPLDPGVSPAMVFYCRPPQEAGRRETDVRLTETSHRRPESSDDLAFLPVSELAGLLRRREITSVELTELYLRRLRQYDPALLCVAQWTEERALEQARQADREMSAGRYRGPLHGVPWGAKDLIAYPPYKTGWGAAPFRDQVRAEKATVASRLDEAGAVLVAKLALGALAWGDTWYGGVTRNPWNTAQGASGSSAGSASATAAGLAGFTLGSETLGSIVSPCRRCSATGLRPTFGRVSRYGCMPLAWSMDKIGPIARGVEDCALVLAAIHGADGLDASAVDHPFQWPAAKSVAALRVGYFESEEQEHAEALGILRDRGASLRPIQLPREIPAWALTLILNVEAACVFDDLTRRGVDEGLFRWPTAFRQGQFTPAVEYLRANRYRTLLMAAMDELFRDVDLYVGGDDLEITNLTGHPSVIVPTAPAAGQTQPGSLKLTGRLFGETELLQVAHVYQQETTHHLLRPNLENLPAPPPEM